MTRTAIIAAMPGELKPLVRHWQHQRSQGVHLWRKKSDQREWIAACAGAGVQSATRAFTEAEKAGALDAVISTGWAGALREELAPGQVCDVSCVIDARTGERFLTAGPPGECWLVTSSRVADVHEKLRLASTYQASLVDMEAAGVARLAQMRGIPFYCVKGISDGYNDQLPDFNRFITANGQFQLGRFMVSCILRPWLWPALIRMGENSRKAAKGIAESLLDFLEERGHIKRRNGYPNFSG
jgi:adenosylhomocysteine nucleosidase